MTNPVVRTAERLAQGAGRFLSNAAALILLFLVALTCVDVVGRYIFVAPVIGAAEMVRICMAGIIFFSLPAIFFREDHIIVDLIQLFDKGWFGKAIHVVFLVVTIAVTWVVADKIHDYAIRAWEDGDKTEFLDIPRYLTVGFIALSTYVAMLATFGRLVLSLAGIESTEKGKDIST